MEKLVRHERLAWHGSECGEHLGIVDPAPDEALNEDASLFVAHGEEGTTQGAGQRLLHGRAQVRASARCASVSAHSHASVKPSPRRHDSSSARVTSKVAVGVATVP